MARRSSFVENFTITSSLIPAVRTASVNATGIDTNGFNGAAQVFSIGVPGITLDAVNKIEVFLEDSDVLGSGYARTRLHTGQVVGGADGLFAQYIANAAASSNARTGYTGNKQFVRTAVVHSGTHGTGTPYSVTSILGDAEVAPV